MTNETLFRSDRLQAKPLRPGDEAVLQTVFEAAGDYFLPITGRPEPDADAAEREIRSCEATEGREAVVLFAEDGSAIGALGWWEGSPEPDIALLGMVLTVPEKRGGGLAREGLKALENHLASRQLKRLRTGVGAQDENRQAFLRALGFKPMDERTHVSLDRGRMMISLFEKSLPDGR
ncbi:MAG: GNAT family N-acetyltransferase [Gemmatimonadetes bacterium]|nr:GNAT family N-acetyltransferase [Gemmatimonadota bacterium]